MEQKSFGNTAIVSCGTLSPEINFLVKEGFLDTRHIFFTPPGLHQDIMELEKQLIKFIEKAKTIANGVIVVYGGKYCYVNPDNPTRLMKTIIEEQGMNVVRIEATHCMGMLADDNEMEQAANELAGGEPVWFMTPGWIKYRRQVFKGWDKGVANENFPRHTGGAIVLDGIGYLDRYMEESPEEFLEYCDWMGIPMQSYPITLDRFKGLLTNALNALTSDKP
ncbi:DUF1638 domain-containing protein [Desulfobacula phenolica]|uniref:DUF1638 domain-containing protein n=1 Tax=Desulfobacula phenolica TaxID=90732 RepID=A0A1H2JUL5_9BACT|nr:DUF1638 domain-containing protein [Desulfobacula phenolica]SDU60070.1 Protein of unknown function [Desulfobacula phenolica]